MSTEPKNFDSATRWDNLLSSERNTEEFLDTMLSLTKNDEYLRAVLDLRTFIDLTDWSDLDKLCTYLGSISSLSKDKVWNIVLSAKKGLPVTGSYSIIVAVVNKRKLDPNYTLSFKRKRNYYKIMLYGILCWFWGFWLLDNLGSLLDWIIEASGPGEDI